MELPAIMQWLKQTFAQRYNALTGRTGHIWGDRYWSAILEGAPPNGGRGVRGGIPLGWGAGGHRAPRYPADVGAEAALEAAGAAFNEGAEHRDRPRRRKRGRNPRFSAVSPAPRLTAPG
jgi:hypothetical protein